MRNRKKWRTSDVSSAHSERFCFFADFFSNDSGGFFWYFATEGFDSAYRNRYGHVDFLYARNVRRNESFAIVKNFRCQFFGSNVCFFDGDCFAVLSGLIWVLFQIDESMNFGEIERFPLSDAIFHYQFHSHRTVLKAKQFEHSTRFGDHYLCLFLTEIALKLLKIGRDFRKLCAFRFIISQDSKNAQFRKW